MDRATRVFLTDIAVGVAAGLAATAVTDLAQGPLNRLTPDHVKRAERRVRPGDTSARVAARELAVRLDLPRDRRRVAWLGKAIHFGIGAAWGPVYGLLRRHAGLRPAGAALTAGATMSLVLDEGVVPALGLSAPNRAYPFLTHVRGFVAHLVFGAAAALVAEALYRLTDAAPGAGEGMRAG